MLAISLSTTISRIFFFNLIHEFFRFSLQCELHSSLPSEHRRMLGATPPSGWKVMVPSLLASLVLENDRFFMVKIIPVFPHPQEFSLTFSWLNELVVGYSIQFSMVNGGGKPSQTTNIKNATKNRPKPKKGGRMSSKHLFSGVNSLLVSGRVVSELKVAHKDNLSRTTIDART